MTFQRYFRTLHFKGYTFIVDKARGYDHHLVLNTLIEEDIPPSILSQGSKIIGYTLQRWISTSAPLTFPFSSRTDAQDYGFGKYGFHTISVLWTD